MRSREPLRLSAELTMAPAGAGDVPASAVTVIVFLGEQGQGHGDTRMASLSR